MVVGFRPGIDEFRFEAGCGQRPCLSEEAGRAEFECPRSIKGLADLFGRWGKAGERLFSKLESGEAVQRDHAVGLVLEFVEGVCAGDQVVLDALSDPERAVAEDEKVDLGAIVHVVRVCPVAFDWVGLNDAERDAHCVRLGVRFLSTGIIRASARQP